MSTDANKQTVERFIAALSAMDVERVNALLTDDARWVIVGDLPISGDHHKNEFFTDVLGELGARFTGALTFELGGMIAEGDKVAAEATSHIEIDGSTTYANVYHFIFDLADGKISHVKEYNDTKHAADVFFS